VDSEEAKCSLTAMLHNVTQKYMIQIAGSAALLGELYAGF